MPQLEDVDLEKKTLGRGGAGIEDGFARFIYFITYLEEVTEVDKHVISGFLLSAGNVEADGDHIETLAPLCEFVLHSKGVQTGRS